MGTVDLGADRGLHGAAGGWLHSAGGWMGTERGGDRDRGRARKIMSISVVTLRRTDTTSSATIALQGSTL